jgi:hypothetical protein
MKHALFALALLAFLPACKTKDAAKCTQGVSTATQAAQNGQFTEARQWRDYAYKQCEAGSAQLTQLDQAITSAETAAQQKAQKAEQAKPLMTLFASFVAQNAGTAANASAAAVCPKEGEPDFGWCTGTRSVTGGTASIEVRYKADAPQVFRYSVKGPGRGSCAQLGGTQGRAWQVSQRTGGVAERAHCKLSGLDAVVSVAGEETMVTVASPGFLTQDPNLKRQIESEGK